MDELVGLLPAAGRGSRLGAIPCSKEIMPLGFQLQGTPGKGQWRPVTAIESHLQSLTLAGATRAAIVVSESKYDIVRYLGDGRRYALSIGYLYQQQLAGMPFALDLATPWIGTATTIFSMPDTLITPVDTAARVVNQHRGSVADVTLGLFETTTPHKFGMVERDDAGRVVGFVDKPAASELRWMWGLAVWSPRFTAFMHNQLAAMPARPGEVVLSDVFEAALRHGLRIDALPLADAHYHDIGTPEDFQAVVLDLATQGAQVLK